MAIRELTIASQFPKLKIKIPPWSQLAQLDEAEARLVETMEIMKKHKIISSDPPDNFVEIEGEDEENLCEGPRSDHEIAEMVRAEM